MIFLDADGMLGKQNLLDAFLRPVAEQSCEEFRNRN